MYLPLWLNNNLKTFYSVLYSKYNNKYNNNNNIKIIRIIFITIINIILPNHQHKLKLKN